MKMLVETQLALRRPVCTCTCCSGRRAADHSPSSNRSMSIVEARDMPPSEASCLTTGDSARRFRNIPWPQQTFFAQLVIKICVGRSEELDLGNLTRSASRLLRLANLHGVFFLLYTSVESPWSVINETKISPVRPKTYFSLG